MSSFLQANGVQHVTSAPYHPATNAFKTSQGQGRLHQRLHNFLLAYGKTAHTTTKASPVRLMLKRELCTTFDFLKPTTVKKTVQSQQENQIKRRERQANNRVFMSVETVLARNYGGGPEWIPAMVVSQTGPVSCTVQTNDSVWRRHLDQLLSTPSMSSELSPGGPSDERVAAVVATHTRAGVHCPRDSCTCCRCSANGTKAPIVASAPPGNLPSVDKNADVPAGCRYHARERWAPVCLNL